MTQHDPAIGTIVVARDFSPTPLGRYRTQGRYSGEAFREDHLIKALARSPTVRVVLDGAEGLSTGFLDEAFAGLVRSGAVTPEEFWARVEIVSDQDVYLVEEIRAFVSKAATQRALN
jgi:hypothetical protein